jgi:hypothetical protein
MMSIKCKNCYLSEQMFFFSRITFKEVPLDEDLLMHMDKEKNAEPTNGINSSLYRRSNQEKGSKEKR